MMERGTWLSELDPITSSTDDTLELQAGSAKLLRMPHSREVRALSQERRRSITVSYTHLTLPTIYSV